MSTRLDLVIQKFPDHEDGIRLLASRDPSGNQKYLDWGARVLAANQALAPEIADVLELFHQFSGGHRLVHAPGILPRRRRRGTKIQIRSDIYSYRPQDLANLRDDLLKIKRERDRKQKKRERLYRIKGEVDVDIVHDSPDLIVRHIKNKQASVHYGLGTKWCISMLREGYFEDYETHNATFFFFERKVRRGDEFDKVALMVPRSGEGDGMIEAFTSTDHRVDMMRLAKEYGPHIFDIFREIWERSESYPGSAMACVYNGIATQGQIESVLVNMSKVKSFEVNAILESICCNDAAPWSVLEEIVRRAPKLSLVNLRRRRLRRARFEQGANRWLRRIEAALVIHPAVPADIHERLLKDLRKRHVDVTSIRRTKERSGQVGVTYESTCKPKFHGPRMVVTRNGRRYYRRRMLTPSQLRVHATSLEKRAVRAWKKLETIERKNKKKETKKRLAETKKRLAKAKKKHLDLVRTTT